VSPVIFRQAGFKFFFYSSEDSRMHVHVERAGANAKFWIEPAVELAHNRGMSRRDLSTAQALAWEHVDEIRDFWKTYFKC
jgi:hypothetical protein